MLTPIDSCSLQQGTIGLDAPIVRVEGTVAANGGGGGGSSPFAGDGAQGSNATPDAVAAAGGPHSPSATCGLPGAIGAAGATLDGAAAQGSDPCGGGGGGGGAGFILVWSAMFTGTGATISPAALANPN